MKQLLATATKLALVITAVSLMLADYVPVARVTLAIGILTLACLLAIGFSLEFAAAKPIQNEE